MSTRARRPSATHLSRVPGVLLDASTADDDKPVWLHVANEGRYKGHWQGEFEFTRATFDTIVKNFRRHPAYRKSADGVGNADVVPYDFHHASEADPTHGEIAVAGAPAQAWAIELGVRSGTEGKAQLWALTRYLEPARTYVREGKYRWTSVAVMFDAVDTVTGEPIGAVLRSIGFTNQPALQALSPITAAYRFDPYSPPHTAQDVLCALRDVFELPATAGLGEVIGEIAKLRAWTSPGASPPLGVDVADLAGALRTVFNLPTMAALAEVLAEADKLLGRLAEEQALDSPAPAAPPAASPPSPAAIAASARAAQENAMTAPVANDLRALLAQRLTIKTEEATDARLLVAVDQGQQAVDTLAALFEALGVTTAQAAAAKAAELIKAGTTLATVQPQLETLRKRVAEVDEKEAEVEVEAALLAHGMPASARKSMLLHRRSDLEDFRKTYPVPDASTAHLTQPVATPPPARRTPTALDRIELSRGGLRVGGPVQPPPPPGSPANTIQLATFPGANNVERAMNMLRAQGDKRPFHELHAAACDIARAVPAA